MKRNAGKIAAFIIFAGILTGIVLAQVRTGKKDTGNTKAGKVEKKVVKIYANYNEGAVYDLSNDERTANVRFTTSFNRIIGVTRGLQADYRRIARRRTAPTLPRILTRIRIRRRLYPTGLAFETQGELVCLVSRKDTFLLRRAMKLMKGQKVIIEGVVIPETAGYKCVLVDDIKYSQFESREKKWEILIHWPNEKPKLIKRPGIYTLRLPDPYLKNKKIEFKIEVREIKEFKTK